MPFDSTFAITCLDMRLWMIFFFSFLFFSLLFFLCYYRPRSEGDNVLGSISPLVCLSIRLSHLSWLRYLSVCLNGPKVKVDKQRAQRSDRRHQVHYLPAPLSYAVDKSETVWQILAIKDCSTVRYRYIFNNLYSKADTYQLESRKLEFDPMLTLKTNLSDYA